MTMLPVDFSRVPYKPKYITSETLVFNYWFKFGTFDDGTVGISDGTDDIFDRVPEDIADKIIEARKQFCDTIEEYVCNFN